MTVAFVQSDSTVTTSNTGSVTLGASPTQGNWLVFVAFTRGGNPENLTVSTGGATWNEFPSPYQHNRVDSTATGYKFWYKQAGSVEPTTWNWTADQSYSGALIVEVSGCDQPVLRFNSLDWDSVTTIRFDEQVVDASSLLLEISYSTAANETPSTPTGFTAIETATGSLQTVWAGYDIGATDVVDLVGSAGTFTNGLGSAFEFPEAGTTIPAWDGVCKVTVASSGADYTSILSACHDLKAWDNIYQVVLDETANFSPATLNSNSLSEATAARANFDEYHYLWITVAPAHRHSGVAGTGHARIYTASATPLYFDNGWNYARVEWLDLEMTWNVSAARGCITFDGTNENCLIQKCILHGGKTSGGSFDSEYGVYIENAGTATTVRIDHCIFYNFAFGFYSGPVFLRGVNTSSYLTVFDIDYCAFVECDISIVFRENKKTCNLYNSFEAIKGSFSDRTAFTIFNSGGHESIFNGSHNASDDLAIANQGTLQNNTTDWQEASTTTSTTTTADALMITDATGPAYNVYPLKATGTGENKLLKNGTYRSAPDSRQNFLFDMLGNPRPTTAGKIDIGPFQLSVPLPKVWNGTAFVEANAVQVYDGTSFVDVAAIQHYDGTSFVDI